MTHDLEMLVTQMHIHLRLCSCLIAAFRLTTGDMLKPFLHNHFLPLVHGISLFDKQLQEDGPFSTCPL